VKIGLAFFIFTLISVSCRFLFRRSFVRPLVFCRLALREGVGQVGRNPDFVQQQLHPAGLVMLLFGDLPQVNLKQHVNI
jgi:hypothetical protein